MDKIKINNQVVVMRKFVKQGKIRVINKFVKEIQLLRNRKGGEQKIAKCQRKADRLLKEVAILKGIKPDTVSRMALLKSKDWKAVLSQKGVSIEDRCLALLASYGPVQEEVEKFYSENSYLTFKIPTLIQEWEEKNSLAPQKNKNSFKSKSQPNEISKINLPCPPKENKLIEKEPEKLTLKQSVVKKDDNCVQVRGSEDMMSDDSGDGGNKDSGSGHFEESNRNKKGSDDSERGDDSDNEEGSDGNLESSEEDEESEDQEGSEESDMHSDGEEKEEGNSCDDLKNKREVPSIEKSKMKSKPAKSDSNILPLSPVKVATGFKNKIPSLRKDVPLDSNSTKAVAMVNLNELMDMEEIPIVSGKTVEKMASESKKRKKDSFFLKDGEEFSDSDQSEDEDSNDDGTITHKNFHSNKFNQKRSIAYHGRTKLEDNSHNFRNKSFSSNAPHGNRFEKK